MRNGDDNKRETQRESTASLSSRPSSVMLVPDALQHLCVFGLTLNAALSWPEARGQRTVDVVELWCGVGSIAVVAAHYMADLFPHPG